MQNKKEHICVPFYEGDKEYIVLEIRYNLNI